MFVREGSVCWWTAVGLITTALSIRSINQLVEDCCGTGKSLGSPSVEDRSLRSNPILFTPYSIRTLNITGSVLSSLFFGRVLSPQQSYLLLPFISLYERCSCWVPRKVQITGCSDMKNADSPAVELGLTSRLSVRVRPPSPVGSIEKMTQDMWVYDDATNSIVKRTVTYVPGLYKIFDEIIVNAADNKQRDANMSKLKVSTSALPLRLVHSPVMMMMVVCVCVCMFFL